MDALTDHGHFPVAAWEASLREAVHQVAAYLVRPVTTLSAFVFQEGDPSVALDVMEWRLGYFKGYGYFPEAMRLYAKQRQLQEIDRSRFSDLLRKVDQKITNAYDIEAWLRLLTPLFDLVRRAQIGHGVPIGLLQAFFKEKEADVITQRLHMLQHQRGIEALDEAEFRQHLEAFEKPAPVAAPPPPPAQPAAAPRQTAAPDQASGPIPRWKQFQQTQTSPRPAPPAPRAFPRTPDAILPAAAPLDARPLWMQFRSDGGDTGVPPPPVPAPAPMDLAAVERAVLGVSGARDRDVFVNNLFARSIDAYERVLRHIHNTGSWAEASKIIAEDVFRQYQVNIYSDPAILFTDAVEAQYVKRDA